MTFKEAVTHVFQNYANFSGRARRSEYWYFTLFSALVTGVLGGLAAASGERLETVFRGLSGLVSLGLFIPGLAVCWRRLHDIGKSGACYFLCLIPIVGPIILLVWYCRDSEPGGNMYGPNPKEPSRYGYGYGYGYGSKSYSGGYAQDQPTLPRGYTYLYCPFCHAQLTLPVGKGPSRGRCSQCGKYFIAQS